MAKGNRNNQPGTKRVFSKNADYQKFETLKTNRNKRHRYGEFFVEGVRNINQALHNGWAFSALLYAADTPLSGWARGILDAVEADQYALAPSLLQDLSGKVETSELMAVVRMRDNDPGRLLASLPGNPLLALFDRPSNKGNLGTILRSCDALGVHALLLTGHGVDPYDPEVLAASMGSFFHTPFLSLPGARDVDGFLQRLRAQYPALWTVATTAHAAAPLHSVDLTPPTLFLLGNETDGLSAHLRTACDATATIPMAPASSASSFNVACAATVLFYEASRQRVGGQGQGPSFS